MEKFLEQFKEFKEKNKSNYNPLLKVLPAHDEVNLHSGILKSLLDPSENHKQGRLFLDLFLKEIKLEGWFRESDNVKVLKEYKNIDIYIHNGTKHIILENKIWAKDQNEQIARYIDTLNNGEKKDIAVIYLTPYGDRDPSENSLNGWNIENVENELFLKRGNDKVLYRQISYEKEILTWLKKSQEKVKNFCNLNQTIEFYKDAINNVIGNGSDIISFLQKESKVGFEQLFKDLVNNKSKLLPKISMYERDYIINKFLEETCKVFDNDFSIDNGSSYIQFILKPKNLSNNDVYFAFAWFDTTNSKNWKNFGIRLIGDISQGDREKIQEKIPEFNGYTLSDYIVFDKNPTAGAILKFIEENKEKIKELNEKLNGVKNNENS
ncbi:PD-(D/E)XK nuclease family protein [Campylobacter sp. CNRCH_2016_3089]|uniref:PDDEXK-like family protein n=1 Tax=unclassified Campylobacter TaxID=2593542 RepID=UPI001DB25D75|nr:MULTISPECIES: PD-(D/E)XK nuclease family protein [unclassified Campylobacter]EGK8088914.1 PD-(D/E)XK nuclease family protein [Campylobacter lari]MCV3473042.1 PD-(D/E)XK nuclease family protein [Campylobacter sp. CNRCH_2014_2849]MCV3507828.1 PD-(D/E)XK nuclease family protein [Campylobacter sp. CNRCH_2016_3089]